MGLSFEEYFLNKILFDLKKINPEEFKKIDYESLVKTASVNLVLPALYFKLKEKKHLKNIPTDLANYLENIYIINKNRNKVLVHELKLLTKILKSKNISFSYLKGSFNVLNNIYDDLGERMVGDIDFLIHKKDLNDTISILNKNGYSNKFSYKIWKTKHPPRFSNKKRLFALEPHTEILIYRKRKYLEANDLLNNINEKNFMEYALKSTILNFQINDYGHLYGNYSLRNIYDIILLLKYCSIKVEDYNNKYYRRFFLITNSMKITEFDFKIYFSDKVYLKRVKLKKECRLYRFTDNLICEIIRIIPIRFMQSLEFIFNSSYRNNVIEKI